VSRSSPLVCIVIGSLEVGGTERHLLQILPALARAGLPSMVYTLTHAGPLADAMREGGVDVVPPPFSDQLRRLPRTSRRALAWPTSSIGLVDTLRRRRPDVVHHHLPAAYLVGMPCAALARVPRQVMSRRCLNVYHAKYPKLARVERAMHRHMRAILGNSRAIVQELADEGAPRERLAFVPNGVDLSRFAPTGDVRAARERLGLAADATIAVQVANLNVHKGHAELLVGLARARARLPQDFVLLCVGRDDGIGRELAQQANELGIADMVRWLGPRADVPDVLASADFAISASHQEGSSNAVLEAMAAGLPVVATAVGGTPEAVHHRAHGLLVPSRDPDALGLAVVELAAQPDLRRSMGRASAQRIRTEFSLPACVDRYLAIYDAVLSDRPLPESVRA
jgi:glycosyltransferase involved in cell wall biosynthesis